MLMKIAMEVHNVTKHSRTFPKYDRETKCSSGAMILDEPYPKGLLYFSSHLERERIMNIPS